MYARRSARYNRTDRPEVEPARYSRYRSLGIKMQMIALSPIRSWYQCVTSVVADSQNTLTPSPFPFCMHKVSSYAAHRTPFHVSIRIEI